VLTAFSVIVLPLTLIASVAGMNVHFPGFDSSGAFWAIMGTMFIVLVAMVSFFRYRDWL
jgi:magnesium transporter